MIYDCFTFFNELDLLEIRLNVLKDVVDKFVLVEAGETHTGKPKPFHFETNRQRYAPFLDRIVYRKIEKFPAGHGAWWNENYQRNEISKVLAECGARDEDDILISDLDEIPNPDAVRRWKGTKGVKVFRQNFYSFYLNYQNLRETNLYTTKMLSYHDAKSIFDDVTVYANEFLPEDINQGTTLTKIRRRRVPKSRGGEIHVREGGWHFTCLGGAEAMVAKMRAVAPHHDFNPDDPSLTVERMADLIAKGQGPALKMRCFAVPIDASFPSYIRENQERYAHLIFKVAPDYVQRMRWARLGWTLQRCAIQFAGTICPPALHNWLHLVKMRLLRADR